MKIEAAMISLACEQAPGGASAEQTPGNRSLHPFSQIAAASLTEIVLLTVKFQPVSKHRM